MYTLDIVRAFFNRTKKPLGITATAIALTFLSLVLFGFGGTVGLALLVGTALLLYYRGNEVYFWFATRLARLLDALKAWWIPIWEDITGEAKAVAEARANLKSARAAFNAALKEQGLANMTVVILAREAGAALKEQLITAGYGDDATDDTAAAEKARASAEAAVIDAGNARAALANAVKAVEDAKDALARAVETYRNGKSREAAS